MAQTRQKISAEKKYTCNEIQKDKQTDYHYITTGHSSPGYLIAFGIVGTILNCHSHILGNLHVLQNLQP